MNSAVYAMRQDDANRRDARFVELDAAGNPTNTYPNGTPFSIDVINAARTIAKENAYSDTMAFLDDSIGQERDTATRNAFSKAKGKFASVEHAEEMKEKLMTAALNGSNAALIAYAAACIYLNPFAAVDFGWFTNGSDELTNPMTQEDGYPVQTGPASQTVSATIPAGDFLDYEGFATTYRVPVALPVFPVPTVPTVPTVPAAATIQAEKGVLTQVATGWQAESASRPGEFHVASADGSTCTCKGFEFHGHCWHTKAVMSNSNQSDEVAASTYPRTRTHNGIFTADLPDGHRTFKIKAQKDDASFMPGQRVVYLLTGSNPEDYSDWTSFGVFRNCGEIALWKSKRHGKWLEYADLLAHPEDQPDVEWNSDESCRFCNRMLTTPTSASLGYGPTCAKKRGLPYGDTSEQERHKRDTAPPAPRSRIKSRMWK